MVRSATTLLSFGHEHSYCRRGEEPALELIDRALKGEGVVITRRGQPVVELKPVRPVPRPIAEADIEWLRARRVGRTMPETDAGTLVSEMRDEAER
jgi:antitoxin (DNA-binding transcriptional repressor) of toxin-antitoxin stability system